MYIINFFEYTKKFQKVIVPVHILKASKIANSKVWYVSKIKNKIISFQKIDPLSFQSQLDRWKMSVCKFGQKLKMKTDKSYFKRWNLCILIMMSESILSFKFLHREVMHDVKWNQTSACIWISSFYISKFLSFPFSLMANYIKYIVSVFTLRQSCKVF